MHLLHTCATIFVMANNPKRSDAQTHRALLLDAADEVFSEQGVHVALELITARAGVSRATLYRNFPNRSALMEALLERAFQQLETQASNVDQDGSGLFTMLGHMAEMVAVSSPVADHWRATDRDGPLLLAAQRRLARMVRPLLEKAIECGVCRTDLNPKDVVLVTSMLGACLRGRTPAERRRMSKRALEFVLEGLRPQANGKTE